MRKNKSDVVPVPRELKNRVSEKLENCISLFYNYCGFELEHPDVYYNVGGTSGGTAIPYHNVIELNPHILLSQTERYLNRTVPHELAHILARRYFQDVCGYKVTSHGKYWKITMRIIGVPENEITRCHDYQIKHKIKRQRKWAYTCGCVKIMSISTTVHNRIQKKGTKYRCRLCKEPLVFSGKEIG